MLDSSFNWASFGGGVLGGAAVVAAVHFFGRRGASMSQRIIRLGTKDPRSSAVVLRDGLVTISGQVGDIDALAQSDSKFTPLVFALRET